MYASNSPCFGVAQKGYRKMFKQRKFHTSPEKTTVAQIRSKILNYMRNKKNKNADTSAVKDC